MVSPGRTGPFPKGNPQDSGNKVFEMNFEDKWNFEEREEEGIWAGGENLSRNVEMSAYTRDLENRSCLVWPS
jgi:hypothetical protein